MHRSLNSRINATQTAPQLPAWLKRMHQRSRSMMEYVAGRDYLLAILLSCGLILLGFLMGFENNKLIPLASNTIARYNGEPTNPLRILANWDSLNYFAIAQHGYDTLRLTNFFPLYPLLIAILHLFIPSYLLAALFISWASLTVAAYYYIKIVRSLFDGMNSHEAIRALLLFLLFPSGVFLFAAYTEGLYAALALASIYFAMSRRTLLAAVTALFAMVTHITGAFLVVLIALQFLKQGQKAWAIFRSLIIASSGIVAYMIFLWIRFKNPFAFITAQQSHGWLQFTDHRIGYGVDWMNIVLLVFLLLAALYWWYRLHPEYSVYCLLFIYIPVLGGQFGGFNRYALMAFPIPLMLFAITRRRPVAYALSLCVLAVFWSYFLFQYSGGYIGG